ncbi:MAG TPA: hypothetical protein VEQ37_15255 [Actinomycetota bacterium]|nr:hypothetical protein [Actinomycetota bacterium]
MQHINRKSVIWVAAAFVVAAIVVGSAAGTGQAIDTTEAYPAPPEAINGGQEAILSIANMAAATCHAKLVFTNPRGEEITSKTIDVATGVIRSFTDAPKIASTSRLTLLAHVVSVDGSCTAFAGSLQVVDIRTNRDVSIGAVGDTLG